MAHLFFSGSCFFVFGVEATLTPIQLCSHAWLISFVSTQKSKLYYLLKQHLSNTFSRTYKSTFHKHLATIKVGLNKYSDGVNGHDGGGSGIFEFKQQCCAFVSKTRRKRSRNCIRMHTYNAPRIYTNTPYFNTYVNASITCTRTLE